jgi:hypothetical protein
VVRFGCLAVGKPPARLSEEEAVTERPEDKGPHYGEPSGQEPDMGEGGSKPDTETQAKRAEEAVQRAEETGKEAEKKAGEGG